MEFKTIYSHNILTLKTINLTILKNPVQIRKYAGSFYIMAVVYLRGVSNNVSHAMSMGDVIADRPPNKRMYSVR